MGGGLMQLVAYGAQDVYLTGDPQITYFKVVYRRHTNFSMECIEQTFSGSPKQTTVKNAASATISRNGDLIGAMHLQYKQSTGGAADIDDIVSEVSVEIGGQLIDKHYGNWLDIWDALSSGQNKTKGSLIGASGSGCVEGSICYVPLQFWFNRNAGLALPLIALQYHEVKVNVTFKEGSSIDGDASLWVDYIYLDTEERKRFAQMSHEYLIDQVQKNTSPNAATSHRLNFNHPVKELVIGKKGEYDAHGADGDVKLTLNGHDRFAARSIDYFTRLQPYYHHTSMAASDKVLVYSFALRPEEHQPSGTCNFSRIDNAEISADANFGNQDIFAVNYNVLRIVSGMGGLAYSN